MVVGSGTFAGNVASRLGLDNVYGDDAERYPHVTLDDIAARGPEVVVLPGEPYRFGPEAFPGQRVSLVDGRYLTWYGPSLTTARSVLTSQLGTS